MSVRIERIELPGIGFRDDIVTADGRHVGVITYRDGRRDVVLYERNDPDTAIESVTLNAAEADALAELLGQTTLLGQIADLGSGAMGLFTERLVLPSDSRFLEQPLGATQARTKTGVSIVAICRGDQVITSPTPAEVMHAHDVLIAVGTRSGLDALERLLAKNAL